jgi:hypothetical protein
MLADGSREMFAESLGAVDRTCGVEPGHEARMREILARRRLVHTLRDRGIRLVLAGGEGKPLKANASRPPSAGMVALERLCLQD